MTREWVLWILFGVNALMAIFWAARGFALVGAGLGFVAGVAFMNAWFAPHLRETRRLMALADEKMNELERELRRVIR